jgi:hypothetical protein
LLPAIGLALAAGALDASAQDSDAVAAFVGQPVYESDGALLGFVSEVIVDRDDSTVAIVKRIDGTASEVPLGNADVLAAHIPAAEAVDFPDEVKTTFIVPEYRTPESPGS